MKTKAQKLIDKLVQEKATDMPPEAKELLKIMLPDLLDYLNRYERMKIATQILSGILSNPQTDNNRKAKIFVKKALELSDELLKQLEQGKGEDIL